MAKLIYSALCSLDGYTTDENGAFEWAAPDREVSAHVNEIERPIGTYLYGRRMYETMVYWETTDDDESPEVRDYVGIWRAADKVVYSSTLSAVTSTKTRLEREFDPDSVRRLKAGAEHDLSIGGPSIAAHALAAGLVDEIQLYLNPVVIGGGTQALPTGVRLDLELLDQHRFGGGVVYLRYRVA
jgi:dihydrofolate reductase